MNSIIKIKKKQTKYYNYSKINTYRLIANEITRLLKRKKYLKLLKQKKIKGPCNKYNNIHFDI